MKTGRYFLLLLLCLVLAPALRATHNRAGEITYTRIAPIYSVVSGVQVEVYRYRITVIKYTDYGTGIADRCVDTLYFGDGERGIAPRINGASTGCCPFINGAAIPCGSIIISDPGYTVNKSIYITEHTYPGPGTYLIRSFDPNRNAGVINIKNSVNQPFYVESLLIINSFSGANSSPVLNNAPIDKGCVGQCFEHNPGAFDIDGDSLSYEITTSRGAGGLTVTGYSYPYPGSGGIFAIDPVSGLLKWCDPQAPGEYNVAFIVKEWRKNTNKVYQLIGYVLRDMQVIIGICSTTNGPPNIKVPADTCVEAGAYIEKPIIVSDPNDGHLITLEGSSGAFSANNPTGSLSNTSGTTYTAQGGQFVSTFRWQTSCSHIREQPYYTTFKATDNNTKPKQVTFATYGIRVVPPSVKNVTATPVGSSMKITWSLSTCTTTDNPITAYKIYRKSDCAPFIHDPCSAQIPVTSGFELVGQTDTKTSQFIDNNKGDGLVVGQSYGYIVVAVYADGTQTFGSAQVCGTLKRDVPVILNVDVLSTSVSDGSVFVKWSRPLTTPGNLDLNAFPGPYKFVLKHFNTSGGFDPVFTTTATTLAGLDTAYTQGGMNTTLHSEEYTVEFYSGTVSVGSSQKANSVFLVTTPADRRIELSWSSKTPWNNYKYTIRRKDPTSTTYTAIATTTAQSYTDKDHVVNRYNYCYDVISEGAYSDGSIAKPLINHSEQSCAVAKDETPPCSPTLAIEADCPTGYVKVSWNDVRSICDQSDDVVKYNMYYKPTVADEYTLLVSFTQTATLEYVSEGKSLISGCYAIQSIDSAGNISPFSADFCIDNCPIFELPNIFTPNKDNVNDFFQAVRVRQIQEINLTVYDRWGNLVYRTKDPYFKWNGVSIITNLEVSEGTFFYICDVFEPRLRGITKRTLKGNVTVSR